MVKMDAKTGSSSRDLRIKMKSRRKKQMKRYKEKIAGIVRDGNPECYEYLTRISETVEKARDDPYDMEILAGNVFNEIKGNEIVYSKIRLTSGLIEDLMPYSKHKDFSKFVTNMTENLRPIFTDRVASHILQRITTESLKRYLQTSTKETKDENLLQTYFDTIIKISKFALNNLNTFIWETSSNHVMRTVLHVLNGYVAKEEINDNDPGGVTPPEFQSLLEQFSQAMISLPQFHKLCNNSVTSGLLQVFLLASKQNEHICKQLIKKIIQDHNNESPDFENEPLLRLIESALEVANEKQMGKLYKTFFSQNLKSLSVSKSGNFAVQKLIRHCKNEQLFVEMFEGVQSHGESILEAQTTGILLELAQGCIRFKTKQGEFVKMMMRILQCEKTRNEDCDIIPLCCSMTTPEKYDPESTKINLHGALIVQKMLHFGKPIKIINSLLNMDTTLLIQLISDPRGCYIIDAFIQSPSVGEKSRDRLFKKLLGSYAQLAMSKHGSRSLDAIWSAIKTKNKVLLMEELTLNESDLTSNQFGKFFVHKSNLHNFRRNRDEWIRRDNTVENAKKCFSDIIPTKKPKLQP